MVPQKARRVDCTYYLDRDKGNDIDFDEIKNLDRKLHHFTASSLQRLYCIIRPTSQIDRNMSSPTGSSDLSIPSRKSRKYELLLAFVILIVCGGVFRNSPWVGHSSDKEQVLGGARLISRSADEKSVIPPYQKASEQVASTTTNSNEVLRGAQPNSQNGVTSTRKESAPLPTSFVATVKTTNVNANPPVTNTNNSDSLTREQCKAKYGERKYLPLEQKKLPPMLYTFPGAGNTWCRLLIEYSTGIYTGSVYNDKSLLQSLPGEFTCNWQVSAIKVHPHTHPFEHLRVGHFHSDGEKCPRGNVNQIKRAILVIRDPFDSIWSEFQRRVTQSHVGGIMKSSFDWHKWQANAASLAHAYHLMWAVQHAGIEKHYPPSDYLYVKYEDLKNKAARVETLRKIAQFLSISKVETERLECAFALADKRDTHRVVNKELTMTKEDAYTVPLACRMWALFGKHAAKHGYTMWKNMDCTHNPDTPDGHYPPIPRINTGPQGEYDKRWVKPGGKLIDFGGHPPNHPDVGKPMKANGGVKRPGVGVSKPIANKPQRPVHILSNNQASSGGVARITTATKNNDGNTKSAVDVAAAIAAGSASDGVKNQTHKKNIEALSSAARSEFRQQKRKEGKQGHHKVTTSNTAPINAKVEDIPVSNTDGKSQTKSVRVSGMTMQQASEKDSVISQVGADKPAWA